ncbi:MAG: hypothetical protein RB296_09115 [Acidobacteriota bacterium]|jgi:hypothetical protein|nr:hypothetical protein [Acidobacteriota bacterium]
MYLTENIAFSLIGVLVGYLIGNRLAIGRDRRKEFNILVDPIRISLLGEKHNINRNQTAFNSARIELIREELPFWKRRRFDEAVKNYRNSKSAENRDSDGTGGFTYRDFDKIKNAIDGLLKYLKRK